MNDVTELAGSLSFGDSLGGSISFGDGGLSGSLSFDGANAPTGTFDYEELHNKPSIDGVVLVGDKTLEDLGDSPLTNLEIQAIFDRVFGKD